MLLEYPIASLLAVPVDNTFYFTVLHFVLALNDLSIQSEG